MTSNLGKLPETLTKPDPDIYLRDNYIVVDMETTNLDKGSAVNPDNRLLYTHIKRGSGREIGIKGNEIDLSNYLKWFEYPIVLVAHNAKFELQWLYRAGLDLTKVLVYDTMLGDYVLAGNRSWPLDLDSVAKRYKAEYKNKFIKSLISGGVCPSIIPFLRLASYCRGDVLNTERIFLEQRKQLKEQGLLQVQYTRCMITPFLAEIGMTGMHLDSGRVHETHIRFVREHQELIRDLNKMTGGINMASPQQVAKFLYEDLGFEELKDKRKNYIRGKVSKAYPEGAPKTDEDTLQQLKVKTKRQQKFIDLKSKESKLRKKITGYTKRFVEACDNNGCMIHGTINQSVTMTHRLSSSNPNQQNIDRTLKKLFNSRNEGWKIRSNDYRQLEYRVAGILAQDKEVLRVIQANEDVHQFTADTLTSAGQPTSRQDAKEHTFKPLYGGTSGTRAEQTYYKTFKEKYSAITEMQERWVYEVLDTGKYRIPSGLVLYFPDTKIMNSGYITNNESIKNYPVQGIATGDIAPIGAVCLWYRFKSLNLNSFIINIVHDSVENEEDPNESELIGNLVEQALSKDIVPYFKQCYNLDLNFPLEVESKLSNFWGSA